MKRKAYAILFGAYVVLLIGRAGFAYPEIFSAFAPGSGSSAAPEPARFILPAVLGEPSARSTSTTSVYRGDVARSGVARTMVPLTLRERWHFAPLNVGIHGASKSSPAVDASGVYVGTDAGYLLAFDLDGKPRWRLYLPDSPRGVHATAALDGDTVYVGAYNGIFYALDKNTGTLRWSKKLGDSIGASAVLYDGALYVSVETSHPNGYLVKLRARDGELVWVSPWLEEQSHSSPTLDPKSDTVMLGSNSARFWAFSMREGTKKWTRNLLDAMKGTALVLGDVVYFASWEKRALALRIEDGRQLWALNLDGPSQVSATYLPRAGLLAFADHAGHVRAVRPADGHVVWESAGHFEHYLASGVTTRTTGGREAFWTLCHARTLCAFASASGKVLRQLSLAADFSGQPVAFGDALYLALDGAAGGLYKFSGVP